MTIQHTPGRSGATGRDLSTTGRLTNGLGWFSIGLGLAELAVPDAVAAVTGVRNTSKTRTVMRLYGLRELAAGVGILAQRRPAGWLWARVGGDALDLLSLASAARGRGADKTKVKIAIASVVGVTAADVFCANQLSDGAQGGKRARIVRTIIVDRPVEEIYQFWRNFQNLPRFITYVQSVRYTGDRRTHWVVKGPAGRQIEWDAETIIDEPNRRIAWRSAEGSLFKNSGSVQFERAPGDRGTLVRVEIDLSSNRGAAGLGKLLQMGLGPAVDHHLRNFKRLLEVGEIIQSEASVHPGMHAAQPEHVHQ